MRKIGLLISLFAVLCVATSNAAYVDEYPESYTWAYKNGITTMNTMDKANMYGEITRIELSKMISNYAINILKKKPDTSKKCEFSDISDRLNSQYDLGVIKACQLGLMGQGITKFRPYDKVTRAEFGTILSRLLYGTKYDGGKPYYIRHINNLIIRGIMNITKNAEKVNESRGNVMVMLKRSKELGKYKTPTIEELNETTFKCPYCAPDGCDFYDLGKGNFIIPYKDGYVGYDWRDEMGDARLNITYRMLDDPCEIAYEIDVFHYNYDNVGKIGCVLDYGYSDKKVEGFISNEKDPRKCMDDAEKYFYELIIGGKIDEIFTLWIKEFKKKIYNNTFFTDWSSKIYECKNNHKTEGYKDVDITDFMTETTFDADGYVEAVKEYNLERAEIGYFCIKEILKN